MNINLYKLGNTDLLEPRSLASCMQFTALWAGDLDRASLAQLCAGAIGICTANVLPPYRPASNTPLGYGYQCMDLLLNAGVGASNIYDYGTKALMIMAKALPKEAEVAEQVNFTLDQQQEV
jgi:hypothetical protein